MRIQARAGALLLTGVLAGTVYGATLMLPQQQQQQDDSAQQKGKQSQDDKKKKPNAQGGNSNNAQQSQSNTPPANNPPPGNSPPSNNPSNGDKPTPLFGGTIGLKSSRQTKDSATLGFNGVDPNGQVQKSMLSASTTAFDASRAQQVAQIKVAPADLVQFIQDGGLTPDAAPQKP